MIPTGQSASPGPTSRGEELGQSGSARPQPGLRPQEVLAQEIHAFDVRKKEKEEEDEERRRTEEDRERAVEGVFDIRNDEAQDPTNSS